MRTRWEKGRTPGGRSHKILTVLHEQDAGFKAFKAAIHGEDMSDRKRKDLWHLLAHLEDEGFIWREGNLFAISPSGEREPKRLDALLAEHRQDPPLGAAIDFGAMGGTPSPLAAAGVDRR